MATVFTASIDPAQLDRLDRWRGRMPRGQAVVRLMDLAGVPLDGDWEKAVKEEAREPTHAPVTGREAAGPAKPKPNGHRPGERLVELDDDRPKPEDMNGFADQFPGSDDYG